MFAVIKTGGKQYRVEKDVEITIEKLAASEGDVVQFNEVLMLGGDGAGGVRVGQPMIEDAGVQAEVVSQFRGEKVYNFKKRRRKHSSARLKGHRQSLTTVKIRDILASGAGATGVKEAVGGGEATDSITAAPASFADLPAAKAEAPAGGAAAEKPENLLTEAQGEADDLTKISGVGPKLNDKLNANGVFHFWQIAAWGPEEIAYMDDQLSFKGRIERDNWIDQAKKLAEDVKNA